MAGDPAIEELNRNIKALDETLKAATRDTVAARDGIKKLGDSAKDAKKEFVDAGAAISTALGNLASNAMQGAIDGTVAWARGIDDAAARAEQHQRALSSLGAAYGAVQQATSGVVTAEQALRVQQTLAQSGLTLTARELAAVTQRAREYARATGTEITQALDQMTDALRGGEAEGLRRFGISVQSGTNKADAMASALRQVQEQARTTGTSMQSLAEASSDVDRAWSEINDAFSATLAQELGLRDFFTQLASQLRQVAHEGDSFAAAMRTVAGTAAEAAGIRTSGGPAQNQSASGAFAGTYGQLLTAARRQGIDTRRFPMVGAIAQAAPDEQRRLVDALTREINARRALPGAAGLFGGPVDLATIPSLGEEGVGAPTDAAGIATAIAGDVDRRRREEATAAARRRREEEARRRAELARIRAANTSAPSQSDIDQRMAAQQAYQFALAGQRPPVSAEWAQTFTDQMRAMQARDLEARGGSVEHRFQGIELQRQVAQADVAIGRGRGGEDFDPTSSRGQVQASRERIRIIREQREALVQLLQETDRQVQMARQSGATEAEVNDLLRQRIGIQTAMAASNRELAEAQHESTAATRDFGEKMLATLESTTDAFGEAVAAALEGSKSFAESMEEMLRATMRSLVKQAIVEGLKHTALGIGKIADYDYPGAAQEFAAAGAWAAVGVAAGAGLAAMGPSHPSASARGASGGALPAGGGGGRDRPAQPDRGGGGPLALTINVSGAAFTDAGVHHAVAVAVREAAANGYLTPSQLGGFVG